MIKTTVLFFSVFVAFVVADWQSAPVPIFLMDASDGAKDTYYQIISGTESEDVKKQKIQHLIVNQTEKIQQAYKKFLIDMKERLHAFGASVNAKVSELSADVRIAIGDLHRIRTDASLSAAEKRTQVQTILSNLTPTERQEVNMMASKFEVPVVKN